MRKLLPLVLLLVASMASAQHPGTSDTPVVLKQLPTEAVVLNRGWKFQADDNPTYADPLYDDGKWQPIDPTKDIYKLPQLWKGIGWLRLHFQVDSSLLGSLVMEIQQSGASEIYLNGKLLHRLGVVSTNPKDIKAYSPFSALSLPNISTVEQVLAVRYTLQPKVRYTAIFATQNPGLSIVLNAVENGKYQNHETLFSAEMAMFRAGVSAILCVLYFAFYLFNRTQKVNLLFSLYAFINTIADLDVLNVRPYVQSWFPNYLFQLVLVVLAFYCMITAIYRVLEQKRSWVFYSLIILGIISLITSALFYRMGWNLFAVLFTNLVNIEITRISLRAVQNRKKGAWIIAAGGISYLVFWLWFTLQYYGVLDAYVIDPFTFAVISIPVAVSIYLGYDFALTHRALQQKLTEVETLSYEKQQILTSQKEVLEQQVTERTAALNQSLQELKATQAQLVQREKMASLGELTAGIAHEIQNPLNFVNNFSEINSELIEELKQEAQTGNTSGVIQLAEELKENQAKIAHHGKRADSIVRGMLQHSRASTGEKEAIDLNALTDEYLRLSYHGVRAKEKSFSCELETQFDPAVGMVDLIPQDIGRVLLNLINNAFYATVEKKKLLNGTYEPVVTIRTKRTGDKVEIQVTDNGTGIPKKSLDKIFQPFFTTKPPGEGTGLGLSLSYDIITKGHGGELLVTSEKGQYTTFVVRLPT